jgi:hypothetical protein
VGGQAALFGFSSGGALALRRPTLSSPPIKSFWSTADERVA